VPLEEPSWWYGGKPAPALLAPLGRLYGGIAEWRFRRYAPYRSRLPVICIGNFTAGGTGKTPLSILIARMLQAQGLAPAFLTRGYGGRETGPAWVDTGAGGADRFGDEPLLLARAAPTVVARDRALGAQLIEASGRGISAIIMDDGLQNPSLAKDLTIAVVDGARGLGNGAVIPAGPLRAPIDFQMGLVDAIGVTMTGDANETLELMRHRFPGPVLELHRAATGDVDWLKGTAVVAFAGIANPGRFFAQLEELGADVKHCIAFRDHHAFTRDDAERLLAAAAQHGATLVTTEKDWARLQGKPELPPRLVESARTLAIETTLEARDRKRLESLIATAMQKNAG
jgi:tetraacyldisaccharide 4'-kinase